MFADQVSPAHLQRYNYLSLKDVLPWQRNLELSHPHAHSGVYYDNHPYTRLTDPPSIHAVNAPTSKVIFYAGHIQASAQRKPLQKE